MNWMKWMVPLAISALMIGGCSPGSKYEHRLKRELASGVRYDSLFMGISLGMTDKEFYTHCWKLNDQGVVKQGVSNLSVECVLEDELTYRATMNFYPVFDSGRIVEMPVRFIYNGWAPWTKELEPDKLALAVKSWYESIYGKGFITVTHPVFGDAFIKIDGNRRITIYVENDFYVWARFTDMLASVEKDNLADAHQN